MIQITNRIFNCTGYTKLTLAMNVLHNLQVQLPQCHIFFLNADTERDCLISDGTSFCN